MHLWCFSQADEVWRRELYDALLQASLSAVDAFNLSYQQPSLISGQVRIFLSLWRLQDHTLFAPEALVDRHGQMQDDSEIALSISHRNQICFWEPFQLTALCIV